MGNFYRAILQNEWQNERKETKYSCLYDKADKD